MAEENSESEQFVRIKEIIERHDLEGLRNILSQHPQTCSLTSPPPSGSPIINVMGEADFIEGIHFLLQENVSSLDQRDNHGNTPLHIACSKGHLNIVRTFLDSFDTSITNKEGYTLLHVAMTCSNLELIQFLVDKGFDPGHCTETDKLNCLHLACKHGDVEIVRYFIEGPFHLDPITTTAPSSDRPGGQQAVHFAALHGHLELLKYLVEECGCDPEVIDNSGKTPTLLAGECRKVEVMKYLIEERQCDPSRTAKGVGKVAAKRQAIHGASFIGDLLMIKYLIEVCGIHPYVKDDAGVTPLACAAQEGRKEVVEYLCSVQGSTPNVQDVTGRTSLHYSCLKGSDDVVKYLCSVTDIDVDLLDNSGETCIVIACKNGHKDIVEFLLMERECNISVSMSAGRRVIDYASSKGWLETVVYLVTERQSNPEQLNEIGLSPLHYAAEGNALSVMKYYLEERKCNPNLMSKETDVGSTPLLRACTFGCMDIVRYLVKDRACSITITSENKLMTPLHMACSGGHSDVAKFLIEVCNHVIEPLNSQGALPLHMAILNGHLEITRYLIEEQISDPMNKTKGGATGFHAACQGGSLNILVYLLEHPRFREVKDQFYYAPGGSPLDQAAEQGHLEIVHYLVLNEICNPQKRGDNGFTCLHWAAQKGRTDIVKFLVDEVSCDELSTNFNGQLPLHLACSNGHVETVQYLVTKDKRQLSVKDTNKRTPLQLAKKANILTRDILTSFVMGGSNPDQLIEAEPITCNFMKSCIPLYTHTKVFVLGNSERLVRELKGETDASPSFALPIHLSYRNFRSVGDVMLYEVAPTITRFEGVLSDALKSCEHPVFIVCLDLHLDFESTCSQLTTLLQLIRSLLDRSGTQPSIQALLIVALNVGSTTDNDLMNDVSTHCLSLDIPNHKLIGSTQVIYCDEDCPPLAANKLLLIMATYSNSLQPVKSLDLFPTAIRSYTIELFRKDSLLLTSLVSVSCQIIAEDTPLPSNLPLLADAFKQLSRAGHLIFIEDSTDISNSIIILDTRLVLNKLFEATSNLSTFGSQAMASTNEIFDACRDCALGNEMFIGLLQYMNVCIDINRLAQVEKHKVTSKVVESKFFFPSLLSRNPQSDLIIQTDLTTHTSLGWLLECDPPHLFSPLLCNQLPVVATDTPWADHGLHNGSYNMWSGGVQYTHQTMQVTLTHLEGEAILLVIKDLRKNRLSMAKKRSLIIENVLNLKELYCPEVTVHSYLLHPLCLTTMTFESPGPALSAISVMDIIDTLGHTREAFNCSYEDLAGFEPLLILGKEFSTKLFDLNQSILAISPDDQHQIVTIFTPYCVELAVMLNEELSHLLESEQQRAHSVFTEWITKGRDGTRTYGDLWNCLKLFSIFSDLSPLSP